MSDFRDTITNVAKSVTKTSGDLLKTTKLNMNLSTEEGKLKSLYLEIGKKVHEIYQYGGSLGTYFDEKYLEILTAERKISEMKEQISAIKGVRNCPKCGKSAERESEFCPKCGMRFEFDSVAREYSEPTVSAQPVPQEWVNSHVTGSGGSSSSHAHVPHTDWSAAPSAPVAPAPPVSPPSMPIKICRVCKKENEASTKFCFSCGRILD